MPRWQDCRHGCFFLPRWRLRGEIPGVLAPGRIHFAEGSWYGPLDEEQKFDVIVSNPPYVESQLCGEGPLRFEPRGALDGGPDGLRQLREMITGAPQHLKLGGMLGGGARRTTGRGRSGDDGSSRLAGTSDALRSGRTRARYGGKKARLGACGRPSLGTRASSPRRGQDALVPRLVGEGRMPSFPG